MENIRNIHDKCVETVMIDYEFKEELSSFENRITSEDTCILINAVHLSIMNSDNRVSHGSSREGLLELVCAP